jgi:hypothetical protein
VVCEETLQWFSWQKLGGLEKKYSFLNKSQKKNPKNFPLKQQQILTTHPQKPQTAQKDHIAVKGRTAKTNQKQPRQRERQREVEGEKQEDRVTTPFFPMFSSMKAKLRWLGELFHLHPGSTWAGGGHSNPSQ